MAMNTSVKNLCRDLLFLMLLISAGGAKAQPYCGDLLAQLGHRPGFVVLLECTQHNDIQGKPFVARYRVKGSDAHQAERYLRQAFGLPELRFMCCGWDSTLHFYRDEQTRLPYMIGMGSEETLVNTRDRWHAIPFFYINVSLFTEDP
ncbi:DUF4952 domain-containing protein [Pseudomonas syringae]|nr:DUF4952 domain-containing protein [Pseudomonas syringae]